MWVQLANAAVGIWLMAAPDVLGYGGPARAVDRTAGPLAAGVALVAAHQAARPLRWGNLPLGLWLLVAPWALAYGTVATANSTVAGLLLAGLASVRGAVTHRFGGGWVAVWRPDHAAPQGRDGDQGDRNSGQKPFSSGAGRGKGDSRNGRETT